MRVIQTKTTYLQMFERPEVAAPEPRRDLRIRPVVRPTIAMYRDLYRGVGGQWNWVDRLVMPDEQLQSILSDDRVDVLVLAVEDETAGYAELDRRQPGDVEVAYFGLFPKFVGQGLGKYFLNRTLLAAWDHKPRRVWLHTCDLDHPTALPNYRKAGLEVYEERIVEQLAP